MSQTIHPHRLPHALDDFPDVRVLSLDCFDTLLWRDVHAPYHLFELLDGVTTEQRQRAEAVARKGRLLAGAASTESTLREIYAALDPSAHAAAIEARVAHEIDAEARHCYGFGPTVALMREAKRRGLRIVIVSDTYLERPQLADLIRRAAGDEVADMIDHIFCSSEYRSSKSERLFESVLRQLKTRPSQILHIGDNPSADIRVPGRLGIPALHLLQFGSEPVERLRLEVTAGAMMADEAVPFQPHRAALAIAEPQIGDAAERMGFTALGPVLTGFARWIAQEADALRAARPGKVHTLFLLRDGFLPRETYAALFPDEETHAAEISRFTSVAAGVSDPAKLRSFVTREVTNSNAAPVLRQLLLTEAERDALVARLPARNRAAALTHALLSGQWMEKICARGRAAADLLVNYVRQMVDPAPGDTLLLVDLGYNGSVQNQVDAILAEALGVHVAGRYLLLREDLPSGLDKRGLIDPRHYDDGTMRALMKSIAVLEQFCTLNQGSVIGYTPEGGTIRAEVGIKGGQSAVREAAQRGCLHFAATSRTATVRADRAVEAEVWTRATAPALARLLFLPLQSELALIERFEHDANQGTDHKVDLFRPESAAKGLRERGLFYLKRSDRMYLPAEVRGQGLPTSLTLMAQNRFDLDLRYVDFCDHRLSLTALMVAGTEAFIDTVDAVPTHQGYYLATVPIGACRYTAGVQFGRDFEWLQIESARFMPVARFLDGERVDEALGVDAAMSFEGIDEVSPGLFRCADGTGFVMVPPPPQTFGDAPMMLGIVFRPLVPRQKAVAPVVSASPVLEGASL